MPCTVGGANNCKATRASSRTPAFDGDASVNRLLSAAKDFLDRNDFRQAMIASDRALILKPKCGQALLFKGLCFYKLERPNEAVNCLSRGLAMIANMGKDAQVSSHEAHDFSWYILAAALVETGRSQEAITTLDKAIAIFKNKPYLYSERGNIYYMLKRTDKALLDYNAQINADPSLPDGYENRAKLHMHLKEYKSAISDLSKAISLQPQNSNLYANRAEAYSRIGELELSKKDTVEANKIGESMIFVP